MTKQHEIAAGLRQLADFMENVPDVATPYSVNVDIFWQMPNFNDSLTLDQAREVMSALPGGWEKDASGSYTTYRKSFGPHVAYLLNVHKSTTCERVQVGTRVIPATEEHEEPVYEWKCQ